jgi:PAS domain S-box-containing protein
MSREYRQDPDAQARGPESLSTSGERDAAIDRAARRDPREASNDTEQARLGMRELERELEEQESLNAGLRRRCRALEAEVQALTVARQHSRDGSEIERTAGDGLLDSFEIDEGLLAAVYLLRPDERLELRCLGVDSPWNDALLRGFFGYESILRQALAANSALVLPLPRDAEGLGVALIDDLPRRCGVTRLVILPLQSLERPLGLLLMAAGVTGLGDDELLARANDCARRMTRLLALGSALAEERRAREHAQEQAALLSAWLSHVPDSVAHLDPSGKILFVNHVMRATQPGLGVGRSWLTLQRPEHRESSQQAFDAVVSTGQSVSYETATPLSDGRVRWHSNLLGPVRLDGNICGAMLVARDISDKKQSEAQLLVADRMASLGLLAASVAHEINNPLAALMINLELMNRERVRMPIGHASEQFLRELEGAREGAQRIAQVARDLKIFSRSHDTLARVHVRAVLESALRMAWNEIRHRARLRTHWGDVPAVDGDESRLGQVFLNLILNAAQAMPEGDVERNELSVETGLDAHGQVRVSIRDTGCGIAPEHRKRLFEPFFTTKPVGVGTGLGLSICERIVRSMGGAISYESTPGSGTTFHVSLPRSQDARPQAKAQAIEPATSRRGRLLVVEDDRLVGSVVQRWLGAEHDVRVVPCAADALQLIEREPFFDVILCDLMMPQMNGQQLYRELCRRAPHQAARMVFMTGGPFTPSARAFLGSVPNHRVEKPFELHVLRRLLAELVP